MPNFSLEKYVWIFAEKGHYIESIMMLSVDVFQIRCPNFLFQNYALSWDLIVLQFPKLRVF